MLDKASFRAGEVKLIRSHAKIDVKTITGETFVFNSSLLAKKCQIFAFRNLQNKKKRAIA